MCGICGMASREAEADFSPVWQMQEAMTHRGPDGAGDFKTEHVALAMRRLSIIDLAGGWQPLYNEDKSLVLMANGEIYNFIELRQQLKAKGHQFRTGGDCETILHLYEDYGLDCVHHLRGMFAFALWDSREQRLILARDRMGEKPLYLFQTEHHLLFASELRSMLSSGLIPFELEPSAIDLYFHYHYVPEPFTPIKSVSKLPAGHILTVDIPSWHHQQSCYWRMEDAPPLTGNPGELIRAELDRVSELVIRADVPVGVALSGGIDSSAVAALAAKKYPGTIHAFSIGYAGRPPTDEREQAQALAATLQMPFHEVEVESAEMVANFAKVIYLRDDPIADISGYGYYAVSKLAQCHQVPVMLQGQGGDELFWGYSQTRQAVYESALKLKQYQKGLKALPNYIDLIGPKSFRLGHLRQWLQQGFGSKPGWQKFQRYGATPAEQMVFYDLSPNFQKAQCHLPNLYTPNFRAKVNGTNAYDLFSLPQPWPNLEVTMTRLISQTYLLENGIAQGDRLSMASSVELRLPLVDYRLVETVIGLRKGQSDLALAPKTWLKAAVEDVLPSAIFNRSKRGFTPPTHLWLRELGQAYQTELQEGYLIEQGIIQAKQGHTLSQALIEVTDLAPLAFSVLVLSLWCQQVSDLAKAKAH